MFINLYILQTFLLQKDVYPKGFFIVFVVNADDMDCVGKLSTIPNRIKSVELNIENSVTKHDYIIACSTVMSVLVAFCLIYMTGAICCNVRRSRIAREQSAQDEFERAQQSAISPNTSGFQEVFFL